VENCLHRFVTHVSRKNNMSFVYVEDPPRSPKDLDGTALGNHSVCQSQTPSHGPRSVGALVRCEGGMSENP